MLWVVFSLELVLSLKQLTVNQEVIFKHFPFLRGGIMRFRVKQKYKKNMIFQIALLLKALPRHISINNSILTSEKLPIIAEKR